MDKIVLKIQEYLEASANGKVEVDQKLLDEFGERCKEKLKKQLEPGEREFKLRMSNIGRPLRQLMLEQKYGRPKPSPDFILKMIFGDMYESLMLYLLKASGVNVTAQDVKVILPIETSKGTINIEGENDVEIENEVWDIKSASPYSFDNKFDAETILTGDDPFGYVDQLFGYAKAGNKKAGGWLPINKADGQIKAVRIDSKYQDALIDKSYKTIQAKVEHVITEQPIPECSGVIPEKFFGKATGNKILSSSCKFCNCKNICHSEISYQPEVMSKAKNPKFQWYIGKVTKPERKANE